jgi:hypothetical protein
MVGFASAGNVFAAAVGETATFNVDKNVDATARTKIPAQLIYIGNNLYIYVEQSWWQQQTPTQQAAVTTNLSTLSTEFDNNIYPKLTSLFGNKFQASANGDGKITVFFEEMNAQEGGYFNEADEYPKIQVSTSNERNMLYVSLDEISDLAMSKRVLAHEFTHLIEFNQKNVAYGVEDDQWLNEARADYSSTILGYDDTYAGSNLQQRVNDFVASPSDALTEWQGTAADYASVSLFTHYLVDHYGIAVLADSLHSKYVGIASLNYALQKEGSKDTFNDIVTNWAVASVANNCQLGANYCYLNPNLTTFKLAPSLNFLPVTGNVSLSVTNMVKPWSGNWLKFIGGNGNLQLNFSSMKGLYFKVPYIVVDSAGSQTVSFLQLDQNQEGTIALSNFGQDYKYLILMPLLESSDVSGAADATAQAWQGSTAPIYSYSYTVSLSGNPSGSTQATIAQLQDTIAYLESEIAALQGGAMTAGSCAAFTKNLYQGMNGSADVKCLQQFLASQGTNIYPSALVTGFFGNLTKQAVILFQEKYATDILLPIGLSKGTGFVGAATRAEINQILAGQ